VASPADASVTTQVSLKQSSPSRLAIFGVHAGGAGKRVRGAKSLVEPANVAVYLARRLTKLSYAEIGHSLGGRDHTTVMHSERRLADKCRKKPRRPSKPSTRLDRLLR